MSPFRSGLVVLSAVWLVSLQAGPASAEATAADRAVIHAQRMLSRNAYDATAYYRLGDAYVQKARETGDVAYWSRAETALRESLRLAPQHAGAARHLAFVLYSRHEFREAAAQASRAIELDPSDGHAFGILGDAHLEVGKYDEAATAYAQMLERGRDLHALGRLAGLQTMRGDPAGAIATLERAVEEGRAQQRPRESVAWAQWQLGSEFLALGNFGAAEARFLDALTTYPNYHRALAGLGHVRVAQERYADAIDLYRRAIAVIPQPDYVAALGDVYRKLGRLQDADRQYALVEYIGRLNALNQVLYNRELAYFYADHDVKLPEALALAERELEVRRDVYAWDLLAWTLLKNGRPQEALAAMTEALRLGTRDARLFFHAGMIYHRLGKPDEARMYLERALATNPRFHVLHAEVATRALEEIGGQTAHAVARDVR